MAVEEKINNEKVKSKKKKKKTSIFDFFRGFKAEINRITWPTKKDIKKATTAVVILCALYIAYVGVIDFLFKNLFDFMFNK
ncbi:preprotein translocase subunit SecE [Clostridium sp. 19966]|uniref:preprotein translocase subunit SecE n=1 Tax=Clostridium sp. 19966 TaxID=2768166 RepID=UPI0028DD5428|nr:preprotein translocase subunit SecE [Clostridium sp. 19966]MDT8715801.1 preprotein translocase subunit SecE [Clostridium sp. 19966]